jgi:MFS family permease
MTIGYLLRAVTAALLFYYSDSLFYIYVLVLVHASIGQLSGPAEAATVPAVVRRDQLPAANSLMMLVLVFGQIMGMVVIAPLLIKLVSADSVFIVSAVLFVAAGYIVGWLASGLSGPPAEKGRTMGFVAATREGFRILRTNRRAYLSMVYLVTAVALSRVLVILLPKYTRDVLQIAPEDTVFIAAPAAIGAGLGLVLVPPLSRLFGAWRIVAFGFAMLLLGLMGLGLVVIVRNFLLENVDLGIGFVEREVGVSSVISVTMLLAIPLGFAFTLVTVASRVVMNEGAPQEAQGRIFAVNQALGDTLSLLPLLLVGVIGELVGVRATLLAATIAAIVATGYLTFSKRFGPREPAVEAGAQPGSA